MGKRNRSYQHQARQAVRRSVENYMQRNHAEGKTIQQMLAEAREETAYTGAPTNKTKQVVDREV